MIDAALVPEDIREMVDDASKFSADHWRMITAQWEPFTRDAARIFRNMGETLRAEALRDRGDKMEAYIEEMGGPGGDGVTLIALFCLSDAKLDEIISCMPQ